MNPGDFHSFDIKKSGAGLSDSAEPGMTATAPPDPDPTEATVPDVPGSVEATAPDVPGYPQPKHARLRLVLGWVGIAITVIISSVWAYWGAIENFHECWYSESIWENLFMLVFQYWLFTWVFIALALVALKWRQIGLGLHVALAVFAVWFFSGASFDVLGLMIVIPILGLGLLYFFGQARPKKWAFRLVIGIPLLIILIASVPQGIRVAQRVDDGDFGARTVQGNGVTLVWAPRGPGWPDTDEAQEICRYLSEDGTTVMEEEQNIWRLPTVDEAVRSMMLHGENAGGTWDPETRQTTYEKTPDKESPLWDVHSQVIYYWTSETSVTAGSSGTDGNDGTDDARAYIIVYHGGVFEKRKTDGQDYLTFRAVKDVPE
jgi:hypothetical protein